MAHKKQNEIINFVVKEVSGVDSGANKKTFYLKKQKDISMRDLLKAIENFSISNEDSIDKNLANLQTEIEKAKGTKLSPDAVSTVKAAIAMLDSVQKELPEGMRLSMDNENFTASVHVRKEDDDIAKENKTLKDENTVLKSVNIELKKEGPKVNQTAEEIAKAEADKIEKDALKIENVELKKNQILSNTRIQKLEDDSENARYLAIAKNDFPHIGVHQETADLLKQTAKISDKAYESLTKSFAESNAALDENSIYKEIGSSTPSTGSAEAQIDKKAEEIKKAEPSISIEKARIKAREQNPELVDA